MNKLISVLTAITMLLSSSNFNIMASYGETDVSNVEVYVEDMSEYGFSNYVVKRYDTSKTRTVDQPSVTIEMTTDEGDTYYFERIGNDMFIYENGEYLTTAHYGSGSMSRASVPDAYRSKSFSAGSGFSNYAMSRYSDWWIEHYNSYVTDKVCKMMAGIITGGISFYILGMADAIYKLSGQIDKYVVLYQLVTKDEALYAVTLEYGSYHKDCNILAWYGIQCYTTDKGTIVPKTGTDFAANGKYTWNGNPNDMTQPYGCRVMDQTYPA